MSILAAIKELANTAETEFEALLGEAESAAWPYVKAMLEQFEKVGESQLIAIAETAAETIGAAVASGGDIGTAIAAAATTAEASALKSASSDGKNALYNILGAVTAKLQSEKPAA